MEAILRGLTDAQREAVCHLEGPLLVLAGPGSGKTRVITHRIAYLLAQGVPANQILALTFTNKAAEEMRARVQALVPGEPVWIGTFHRFCARLLRTYAPLVGLQENYTIYDTEDSNRLLRRILTEMHLELLRSSPEAVASAISWAKNNLIRPEEYPAHTGHPLGRLVPEVYRAYQAALLAANAADFDDLLLHVACLLRDNPEIRQELDARYRFILIDEYQDTNLAQYAIARALSIDYPNLAVTGDPDQSIYGWRGANLNNILEFERDFPNVHVVRLEQNYRSTRRILRAAAELISHNIKRKQKNLYTENGLGQPVRLVCYPTHQDEARDIAQQIADAVRSGRRRYRDFAIFYRINALSRTVELALRAAGIPYQLVHGVEFFQRKEVRDLLAYLRLLNNPRDEEAFWRCLQSPPRGIGKTTVERLQEFARQNNLPLLEALRQAEQIPTLDRRSRNKLAEFASLWDRLSQTVHRPVEEILGLVLSETGYREQFDADTEEAQQRLANIEELLTACREFDEHYTGSTPLEDFLEQTSLVSDTDPWETEQDTVTLMTLHASKGLEFPVVYLIAVEQGLLPHERSRGNLDELEEERRLMFVGMTRAQEELQISYAQYRDFRGQRKLTIPSEFLMELPRAEMEVVDMETGMRVGPRQLPDQQTPNKADRPEGISSKKGSPTRIISSDSLEKVSEEGFSSEKGSPSKKCFETSGGTKGAEAPARESSLANQSGPGLGGKVGALSGGPTLRTAAELAGQVSPVAISPDEFSHGMLVLHPQYGLGRIVALSGAGPQRQATVDFLAGGGRKKFLLHQSSLRPVHRQTNDPNQ
ncbi:MAG: UvrD-helicase domain-containing protein [Thermoguttaceae bacterium]|nr:UvrD-helicase domain-containing protein [Thermoguttaceae bacterium]MDW8037024.1 UvrD-helicase domain-containing protein [Thermoguttaceae bacterium]